MKTKRALQVIAVFLAVDAVSLWLVLGANRGWTKTSREVKTLDAVTGIEGITYEKKFSPGLDFLGLGLISAGVLAGASLIIRSQSTQPNSNQPTPPK